MLPTRLWRTTLAALTALATAGCGLGGAPSTIAAARGAEGPEAKRELISRVAGDSPNFAQLSNGSMMTVVSRDYGRGAKAGALVELYYPNFSTDHLWDAYVGIEANGKRRWAHDMALVGQSLVPDTGLVKSAFRGEGLELVIEDLMPPGANVHLRRATLTNRSGLAIDAPALTFHGFFTLNTLPSGDRLRYDAKSGAMLQRDGQIAVAVLPDQLPDAWQCGLAHLPTGGNKDARHAAEAGQWPRANEAGPSPTGVTMGLRRKLDTLQPGQSASATWAIALAGNESQALMAAQTAMSAGWEASKQREAAAWAAWLAKGRIPAGMPPDATLAYRRALITLKQLAADNGALIAAPTNMNPPYRFVWLRDGALIAQALLAAGYPEPAKAFYRFAEKLQKPDGGWAINYFPDASRPLWDFGTAGNEHDQPGFFAWGIRDVYEKTQDQAWLAERYPAVKKACEFLVGQQRPDGLLTNCRDLWELDQDGTWTFTNAAGWAGLDAGAAIALKLGDNAAAARFKASADRLKAAVGDKLVVDGYFARGLRTKGLDPTVEAANLAIGGGGFGMLPDNDPRMAATGQQVANRLTAGWGGIRRYEGDKYYDGQPWPVATSWLALHRVALGDRAGGRKLFDTMTRYAAQTDSYMLGEQYDERTKQWVSAFPLAWSEAAYVRTALAVFGR